MIVSIVGNWNSVKKSHRQYLEKKIDKFLRRNVIHHGPPLPAYCFIRQAKADILSDSHGDLKRSIRLYLSYISNLTPVEEELFNVMLNKLFNYDGFTSKEGAWNAYSLCGASPSRTCPYCNQAFAFTVTGTKSSYRPTLDHYYSQEHYPHLALTLSNLVPSCYACNSSLKGRADFYTAPHLHPLFDKENIEFDLVHPDKSVIDIRAEFESVKHELIVKARAMTDCKKTDSSLSTFLLNERYLQSSIEAVKFAKAKISFDTDVLSLLTFSRKTLESEILQFHPSDYRGSILGKMYESIYRELERTKSKLRSPVVRD
jgi:5-methylcytosine-specific restriction endonuclease McrA